jgi:hypothetical protein
VVYKKTNNILPAIPWNLNQGMIIITSTT